MKPFILFFQVLKLLQKNGQDGINKFETGLFLQPFRNHAEDLPTEIFEEIQKFRRDLADCRNSKEEKKLKKKYKDDLQERVGINPNSVVRDYSDTTFRYFSLSGLFTRISNTLVIRPNKYDFVEKLLEGEPNFLFNNSPKRYFKHFYNNDYPIPTDEKVFAMQEINTLKEGIRDRSNPLLKTVNRITVDSDFSEI